MTGIYEIYRQIIETTHDTSHDSPVWKDFQDKYNRDAEVCTPWTLSPRLRTSPDAESMLTYFPGRWVHAYVRPWTLSPRLRTSLDTESMLYTSWMLSPLLWVLLCSVQVTTTELVVFWRVKWAVARILSKILILVEASTGDFRSFVTKFWACPHFWWRFWIEMFEHAQNCVTRDLKFPSRT